MEKIGMCTHEIPLVILNTQSPLDDQLSSVSILENEINDIQVEQVMLPKNNSVIDSFTET